jgi:hypothetical protein
MKIRIIVFDGVDEIDFIGPYEVFRRAAKLAGANTAGASATVDVRLVTVEPQAQVTAANGLRFLTECSRMRPICSSFPVEAGLTALRAACTQRCSAACCRKKLPHCIRGARFWQRFAPEPWPWRRLDC